MARASVSSADAKTSGTLARNILPVSCDFPVFSVTSIEPPPPSTLQLRIRNQQESALIRPGWVRERHKDAGLIGGRVL
jgi:hypothetical protein